MKSNRIQIKFSSESHFEKFSFNSETITYQEVIEYLVRKKKIDLQKKTDSITLIDVDNDNAEIQSGSIDAGHRLIAIRKPDHQQSKTETIELTYIPKQTVAGSSSAKQRYEQRRLNGGITGEQKDQENMDGDDNDDLKSEKDAITATKEKNLSSEAQATNVKFRSCKLDMSQVFPELMCPFGQMNEAKYDQAYKSGRINQNGESNDLELMASLVKAHYISVPMLATCCGVSACYTCIKDVIADQIFTNAQQQQQSNKPTDPVPASATDIVMAPIDITDNDNQSMEEQKALQDPSQQEEQQKEKEEPSVAAAEETKKEKTTSSKIEVHCPFCSQMHKIGESVNRTELPFLVHNRQLDNLLEHEIQKWYDQLTEEEKLELEKEQAKKKILDMTYELKVSSLLKKADMNNEGQANGEESQHELIETIDDNTKFFLLKIPNQDCLMNSLCLNEIALTEHSSQAFEKIFEQQKSRDESSIANNQQQSSSPLVLFVTIQGSDKLQGVCKVSDSTTEQEGVKLIEECSDDWKQFWQGKFKSAINVQWLIPNCSIPIAKVSQYLQAVLAKKSSDFFVEMALSDSAQFKVNEAELFNQRVRNLIEISHEDGIQIAKSYVSWQKQKLAENDEPAAVAFIALLGKWKQQQAEKNIPPSLPPLQVENTANNASAKVDVLNDNFGDSEMIDTMLYGDLDLDVKLSDVITGFKEAQKVKNVKSEQESAPQVQPINPSTVLSQVTVGQPQYDAATALLFQQQIQQLMLANASRQGKLNPYHLNQAAAANMPYPFLGMAQQMAHQAPQQVPNQHQKQVNQQSAYSQDAAQPINNLSVQQQQPLSMIDNDSADNNNNHNSNHNNSIITSGNGKRRSSTDGAGDNNNSKGGAINNSRKSEPRDSRDRRSPSNNYQQQSSHHRHSEEKYNKSRSRSKSHRRKDGDDSDRSKSADGSQDDAEDSRRRSTKKSHHRPSRDQQRNSSPRSRGNSREGGSNSQKQNQQSSSQGQQRGSRHQSASKAGRQRAGSREDRRSQKDRNSQSRYQEKESTQQRNNKDGGRDRGRDRDRDNDKYRSSGGRDSHNNNDHRDKDRNRRSEPHQSSSGGGKGGGNNDRDRNNDRKEGGGKRRNK